MPIDASIRFLESVYGPLGDEATLPEEAIVETEQRLGVRLPEALRVLYRRTGAHRLHAVHNTLLDLEQLEMSEHVIFYLENQAAISWGIARDRFDESDPPVLQG